MFDQGQGMLNAVVDDFVSSGHVVFWLQDARVPINSRIPGNSILVDNEKSLPDILKNVGKTCEAILLIAPESGGRLTTACDWLHDLADRLISPGRAFVQLTSDKGATCSRLFEQGVPVAKGCPISELKSYQQIHKMEFPFVLKPNDGAGSEDVQFIRSSMELEAVTARHPNTAFRIEEFVPGLAASVSALCCGDQFQLLPPTQQIFDAEPVGHYVGAKYPLPSQLAERASGLAAQAIRALPPTRGYIGIDLVLSNSSPKRDVVIEVNPRLTMSYLTLREICGFNIADRMLMGLRSN